MQTRPTELDEMAADATQSLPRALDAGIEPKLAGVHETILVVDDDPSVRALIVYILKEGGYRVLEASSGKHAIAIFEQEKGGIDLLLTDIAMAGGIAGKELAEQMRSRSATLRVAFTSGYSEDFVSETLAADDAFHFLQKPFCPGDLANVVRDCLNQKI
jgi:two-component system cell cycle sensor histidine kinase/response regulator CckA